MKTDALNKFFVTYFVVTGSLSFLAMSFPTLIIIGFFLFLIPGIILSLAPTAFMWGVFYVIIWCLLKYILTPVKAALFAVPCVAVILWAIPQSTIKSANSNLKSYALSNITPDNLIKLSGDIRIETRIPHLDRVKRGEEFFRYYSCGIRCLALLFEPNIKSVTINTSEKLSFEQLRDGVVKDDEYTHTYRLLPKSKCTDQDFSPRFNGQNNPFVKTIEDARALRFEWAEKLATEFCLTLEKPLKTFDFLLREGKWETKYSANRHHMQWWIPADNANSYFSEIRTGGQKILFRRFNVQSLSLGVPFGVSVKASMLDTRWGWNKQTLGSKSYDSWDDYSKDLNDILDVRRTADIKNALNKARSAITIILNDKDLNTNSTAFKSIGNYVDALRNNDPTQEDFDLIKRLIMDERLYDFDGVSQLPYILTREQLDELLPLIITKLKNLPESFTPYEGQLGKKIRYWPDGMFANPDEATLALLRDPIKRPNAQGLITRISDMGDRGVPLLISIIEYHLKTPAVFLKQKPSVQRSSKFVGHEAHGAAVSAAVSGMCILGPKAKNALPKMLAIEREFVAGKSNRYAVNLRSWDRMMLRIGKPIDDIKKPDNLSGSEEKYHENLKLWLKRLDPKNDCR